MPPALLDTNAVSDLMRDHPQVRSRMAIHADSIITSAVVVGEIDFGVSRLQTGKRKTDLETRAQRILSSIRIEDVNERVAATYGSLKSSLEAQGLNLEDNDLWIAATALTHGALVVTHDHIFVRIPGLQVEDWSV